MPTHWTTTMQHFRPLVLALTLFALADGASAKWVRFAENDRLTSYYEAPVLVSNGSAKVWVMFNYKAEQQSARSGRKYLSEKSQREVDCVGQRSRTLFFTWHTNQMGEGPVVYTGSAELPWEPNSPASIARSLSSVICAGR